MKRLRTIARSQAGFTLIELLTASVLLLVVLASLGGMFISSSNAEVNANRRFQAQNEARVALERLRRDIRCATSVTQETATEVELVLPSGCTSSSGSVTWCTRPSGTQFQLFRIEGTTCSGGAAYASSLGSANALTYAAGSGGALGRLTVDLVLVVGSSSTSPGRFHITESLVPRNATRT